MTPSSVVASPRNTTTTRSSCFIFAASAAPVAIGTAPPTIAEVPAIPTDLSIRCIEPPREPTQPLMRQCISHNMRVQIAALRQIRAMRAVARVDEIGRAQRRAAPDRRRFLADNEVNRRLHLILMVTAFDLLLDSADAQHRPVPPDELSGRNASARCGRIRRARDPCTDSGWS